MSRRWSTSIPRSATRLASRPDVVLSVAKDLIAACHRHEILRFAQDDRRREACLSKEKTMQRTKPPFRADQVGSLLRSAPVKEARTKRLAGEITPAELKAVEDAEIKKLVARQESIGLQAVTDGEFRRSWWHYDFLSHLDGVELVSVAQGLQFKGTQTKAEGLHVHGKIDFSTHPMIEHFKFLKSVAKVTPKMTIPSPTALHFRGGR